MSDHQAFSVVGIEIEYMLVDRDTLEVAPCSDVILKALAGDIVNEVELGDIAVSNELVMHVLELKNNGPKPPLPAIKQDFQEAITGLQPLLKQHNLQLLPGGAHPWMNPLTETKRWPYGNEAIYRQYDKIFSCQGHGWSNLQSMHVNLPFGNDEEFVFLHNTIRLLLPLLPALAASSPFIEGKKTGYLDTRLTYYEKNQKLIPSISGSLIPEFIHSPADYKSRVLDPMYRDISPYDPEQILQHEWLNSRAAIAKFDMKAIEIRILDTQECVKADIAIALAVHALIKSLHERSDRHLSAPCETYRLKALYDQAIKDGFSSFVDDSVVLTQWQLPPRKMTLRDAWSMLIERISPDIDQESQCVLEHLLSQGSLSERLLRACPNGGRSALIHPYRQLAACVVENQLFTV